MVHFSHVEDDREITTVGLKMVSFCALESGNTNQACEIRLLDVC